MHADESDIRALIARWHAATARGDVDAVLALIAEDVVFLAPGRPPMVGRAAFAAGLRRLLDSHRLASDAEVLEVLVSGDMAVSRCLLTVRVAPRDAGDGGAVVRSGHALSVFRRQPGGHWLLVRDANLLPSG